MNVPAAGVTLKGIAINHINNHSFRKDSQDVQSSISTAKCQPQCNVFQGQSCKNPVNETSWTFGLQS